jgi:hypothetical protein
MDRITVRPATAKKLSILLTRVFENYEKTHGRVPAKEVPFAPPACPATSYPRSDEKPQKGDFLFQLVQGLETQIGHEQSFKVMKNTFLAERFLLGFKKEAVPENRREKILDICREIAMPSDYLRQFSEGLPEANIVLFGFEAGETASLYKAYLEFGGRFEEVLKQNPRNPSPFLLHLGFKWDTLDDRKRAVAEYRCFPSFTVEDMRERLSGVFAAEKHKAACEIANGILDRASRRAAGDPFLYLEVEEKGNPRRSFDINVYRANMKMQELYPLLSRMAHHYEIPAQDIRRIYEPAKDLIFGHLSGGVDREERDFLTWYFGVTGSTG